MSLDEKNNLKLIGKNQKDLKVISAYLQDSIVTVKDMVFLKQNRIFVMIVNRFMWEDIEEGVFRKNKRTRCALRFEEVIEVKSSSLIVLCSRGIDLHGKTHERPHSRQKLD